MLKPRLELLSSRPGTQIRGLDEQSGLDIRDRIARVGRRPDCDVVILAAIGGHTTFGIEFLGDGWWWCVYNEWARATVAGVSCCRFGKERARLNHGDVIDVFETNTDDLICSFRFMLL